MLRVTGLKILGRVGTHIFFNHFFLEKKIMHFLPFKMYKTIFLKKF